MIYVSVNAIAAFIFFSLLTESIIEKILVEEFIFLSLKMKKLSLFFINAHYNFLSENIKCCALFLYVTLHLLQ